MYALMTRFILTAVSFLLLLGCVSPPTGPAPAPADTPISLINVTPLVGVETALRDPVPTPERLTIDENSVWGWLSPPEKSLSFLVELKENAHFSVLFGAATEKLIENGDLTARIDLIPAEDIETVHELYNKDVIEDTYALLHWGSFNADLSEYGPGQFYIKLTVEGRLAGDSEVQLLWGQPTVYYPSERSHKNILLIGVDTLRLDALNIYGGREEISPNLRRLVETGTVFTRCWSQAPITVPSFASMLTGRYPADLNVTLGFDTLPDGVLTVAETLHSDNYATGMVCGNTYLGNDQSGFQQGLDESWYRLNAIPSDSAEKAAEMIEHADGRDWFIFLHLMDPHSPYDPPQEFIDSLCDEPYEGEYETEFNDGAEWQLVTEPPPQEEIERVRCLYDGEAADVDYGVGQMFDYLEANDLLENTLVIFAADHGEEFFEHGQFEHGQSLYEELVHLPLIVWGLDFPEGAVIDTPVGNTDIVPTIYRWLGMEIPEQFPGTPLQDVVSGNFDSERLIFGEGTLRRGSHEKFVIEWPYKFILDFFTNETEVYDLESDPLELTDISDSMPDLIERLYGRAILEMLPIQTMVMLMIIGDSTDGPDRFSGSFRLPGGVVFAKDAGLLEDDEFNVDGETVTFDFSSGQGDELKVLLMIPMPGTDSFEVSVLADGEIDPDRFFPWTDDTPEPSGSATVKIYEDIHWPNRIPPDSMTRPVSAYVLTIPGFPREGSPGFESVELDESTREILRSLGYIT